MTTLYEARRMRKWLRDEWSARGGRLMWHLQALSENRHSRASDSISHE